MRHSDDLQKLLGMARDKSIEGRKALVAVIGDLFSKRDSYLSERERALMHEILNKLLGDFEMAVRRELADRLAEQEAPPRDLVRILANDAIEVAQPLLMQSSVLHDEELIAIIQHRTRQHQLAIALRRELSPSVSDALVERGDDDVIRTLLENPNAQISDATMEYLVEQARSVDSFQEPLVNRADLSRALAKRLYWFVSAALRTHILESHQISENDLDDAIEAVVKEISAELDRQPEPYNVPGGSAWRLAERIGEHRRIDITLILQVLRRGEIPLFEALFGLFAGLRPPRLQHVLYETKGRGVAVVCRAMEVDKSNFAPVFLLSRKGRPGEQVVDPREVSEVLNFFDNLGRDSARHILKSWQRDPEYLKAIDRIEEERRGADGLQTRTG